MKATLLGTGAYGLAIASKLASNNINVCMWTESKEKETEYQKTHNLKSINTYYEMPNNISAVFVEPISGKPVTNDTTKKKLMYFIKGTEPRVGEPTFDEKNSQYQMS